MEIVKSAKTALVFGATGLVGRSLVLQLLVSSDYDAVKVFVRRSLKIENNKLTQVLIEDFEDISQFSNQIIGDDLFLCLGTTIKKAGSKEAFKKIDFYLNFTIAKLASINKVNQLFLVSSAGADPNSFVFYSKIKGELEEALKALPFWAIHIFRPAMLLGKRTESRPLESIGQGIFKWVNRAIGDKLGPYQPITAEQLAQAMITRSRGVAKGIFYYDSDTSVKISKK